MKSATFRLSAQEKILANIAYTGNYMIDSRIELHCVKLRMLSFSFLAYLHFPVLRFSMGAIL